MSSKIEWTEETWNPLVGCTRVSEGCRNCYAERMSGRLAAMAAADEAAGRDPGRKAAYRRVVMSQPTSRGREYLPVWNKSVVALPEAFDIPLRWRKPRWVFVNSMSDLFHPLVPVEVIDRVFAVMVLCPQHTFQVLTKRPESMAEYTNHDWQTYPDGIPPGDQPTVQMRIESAARRVGIDRPTDHQGGITEGDQEIDWPLPNVWLGTSCEDQATADERIPYLLRTPAAVRFLSLEPLLGPMNITPHLERIDRSTDTEIWTTKLIDWVIVGGESGPNARPADPDWFRMIRDQCRAAGVPLFVKQMARKAPIPADLMIREYPVSDAGQEGGG